VVGFSGDRTATAGSAEPSQQHGLLEGNLIVLLVHGEFFEVTPGEARCLWCGAAFGIGPVAAQQTIPGSLAAFEQAVVNSHHRCRKRRWRLPSRDTPLLLVSSR
jgi:hypothetical protein